MSARRFLDTNPLLYSISTDPSEVAKRKCAIGLLNCDDVALSVQVLQEFYIQATRTTRADRLPYSIAAGLIEAWQRFPVQEMTRGVLLAALDINAAHGFSFWDSATIAAAVALGCQDVLTEDISHGREVAGVRIVNPFR